jgi:hypothetical protein
MTIVRTITAITNTTAFRTTAAASANATGSRTISVTVEFGCADSNVLLETAALRKPAVVNIGTATAEREDLP